MYSQLLWVHSSTALVQHLFKINWRRNISRISSIGTSFNEESWCKKKLKKVAWLLDFYKIITSNGSLTYGIWNLITRNRTSTYPSDIWWNKNNKKTCLIVMHPMLSQHCMLCWLMTPYNWRRSFLLNWYMRRISDCSSYCVIISNI